MQERKGEIRLRNGGWSKADVYDPRSSSNRWLQARQRNVVVKIDVALEWESEGSRSGRGGWASGGSGGGGGG